MSPTAATVLNTAQDSGLTHNDTALEIVIHNNLRDAATDWDQLSVCGYGNPYQSHGWLGAWSDTFGAAYHVEPVIVAGRVDGRPVVVLPLGLRRRATTNTLSFLGHENGNQNTGIWDTQFYQEVSAEQVFVLLKVACNSLGADMLVLQNVPEDWHGRRHPLVLASATPSPSPVLARILPSDFETLFRDGHSKSSRKNLLRKQRHLQSVDGYKVVRADTTHDIRRALDAFLQQRATRTRAAGIPNVFSSRPARQFLEMVLGLHTRGGAHPVLDIWFLEAEGKIRATYLCARHRGTLYAYSNSVAHDDLLANSPGLVLFKEIIERACADPDISTLDFGLGAENYKTSWAEPLPLKDSRVAMSVKGELLRNADGLRLHAKSAIRNSNVLWPLVRRLRRWKTAIARS